MDFNYSSHHDLSESEDSSTDVEPIDEDLPSSSNKTNVSITGLHTQKAYTHTGTSFPQILLSSAHAYMHFA